MPSLAAGGGSGAVLMLLGALSLRTWKVAARPHASAPYTLASAAVAAALTALMGKKFLVSGALFPAGLLAGMSLVMLTFYGALLFVLSRRRHRSRLKATPHARSRRAVYNLAAGGNPLPSKKAE